MTVQPLLLGVNPDAELTVSPLLMICMSSGQKRHPGWPRCRQRWLEKQGRCVICGGRELLEVHHERPFHLWPELEMEEENLITLCDHPGRQCHLRWGHLGWWRAYNPLIREDIERIRNRPTLRDDTLFHGVGGVWLKEADDGKEA